MKRFLPSALRRLICELQVSEVAYSTPTATGTFQAGGTGVESGGGTILDDLYVGAGQAQYGKATGGCDSQTLNQPINPNPVTIGTSAVKLMLANSSRKQFIITNRGTTTIYIGFGYAPGTTQYVIPLTPCTSADDGTGGILISDVWLGEVWALSNAAGGSVNVTEMI